MPRTAEDIFKDHLGQLHMELVRLQLANSELVDALAEARKRLDAIPPPEVAELQES